jgi:alanine dehydrogenase
MIIGVPKEIKNNEYRVGLTPSLVNSLCKQGHTVLVQSKAGTQIGFGNLAYQDAGAEISDSAKDIFARADMIVKVKEPQAEECALLREDQVLFTYLHLAPDPEQTKALINSKAVCIAYETVTSAHGTLPLLAPMSEVAGRMAIQAAATHLGVVGRNALQIALGMGAQVSIMDRDLERLRKIDALYGNRVRTLFSDAVSIESAVKNADVVIGGVLLPGGSAPKLVSHDLIRRMRPGSVVVDVAIDQGGCFETSVPTTHTEPTYEMDGVIHYCVANMPGAVARTSTIGLTNATYPMIEQIAKQGALQAMKLNPHLKNGLSIFRGHLTSAPVAKAQQLNYIAADEAIRGISSVEVFN